VLHPFAFVWRKGETKIISAADAKYGSNIFLISAALRRIPPEMPAHEPATMQVSRRVIVQGLSYVEDIVYVGLGALLTVAAITLLVGAVKTTVLTLWNHQFVGQVINLLDQILLILLIVELLYTVQVSFREHGLLAEPFLVIALIAVIRRILVLTAELPHLPGASEEVFRRAIFELSLLAVMVLILVGSLILFQRQGRKGAGEGEAKATSDHSSGETE
jgi:uncharacterized membrane protein (DUF373 family)